MAERFEDLFLGSGVELEAWPFAEVFARELQLRRARQARQDLQPRTASPAFLISSSGADPPENPLRAGYHDGGCAVRRCSPCAQPAPAVVARGRAAELRGGRRAVGEAAARGAGWSETQRASVLSDLQHTLAGQGIAACSADAHPAAAALATLAVDLAAEDTAKATVDIEVRDAVTRKRVRRDVDLSRIPDDGRAAAIAIEADELLRASWAEVALDTARAREAQAAARPQVVGSVQQVLAPARAESGGGLGARAAVEHYFGGTTLVGADGVGRVGLSPRLALEIAGALRLGPSVTAPHGQVSALARGRRPGAAGPDRGRPARVAGRGRRRDRRAGSSSAPSRRRAPRRPAYGEPARRRDALRLLGRLALGRSVHATRGPRRRRRAARRGGDRRRARWSRARAARRWARRSDWRRREPRPRPPIGRHGDRDRAGDGGCTRSGEVLRPADGGGPVVLAADATSACRPGSVTPARSRAAR